MVRAQTTLGIISMDCARIIVQAKQILDALKTQINVSHVERTVVNVSMNFHVKLVELITLTSFMMI